MSGRPALLIPGLKLAGAILVLSVSAMMMMLSQGDAADLRLLPNPAAAAQDTAPSPRSREQLFEEFLRWRRQHSRGPAPSSAGRSQTLPRQARETGDRLSEYSAPRRVHPNDPVVSRRRRDAVSASPQDAPGNIHGRSG